MLGQIKVQLALLVLIAASVCSQTTPSWQPRFLGQTKLRHSAFVQMYFSEDSSLSYNDRWKMYVSTFDALALGQVDSVYYANSPGNYLDNITAFGENIQLMDESAYWPNSPEYMPSSAVGIEGIVQTSGFLVETKKDGQLQMYDTTVSPFDGPYNLAEGDSNEWSYHRINWQDMDLDGDLDCVTARFHVPNIGSTKMEFMYFENPNTGLSTGWTQHVISTDGPDIGFDTVVLSSGGVDYTCYIFAEFFMERITIYWTEDVNNAWTNNIKYRVIDANAGQAFDVLVADLNSDGEMELLATMFDTEEGVGQARVYFFPEDFKTDNFTSIVIADGFVPNSALGGNSVTPGNMETFYPSLSYLNEITSDGLPHKPWIVLSGDDDGRAYILYPNSDTRDEWIYQKHILVDTEGDTVGQMAHGDINGDGYEDIIVPGYSTGELYVYTYAP